uniref:Uncharacterized protein n=1 Tax=Arundo donax TaxID=35708 RepID=A0A0A9ATC6_ARUDO
MIYNKWYEQLTNNKSCGM